MAEQQAREESHRAEAEKIQKSFKPKFLEDDSTLESEGELRAQTDMTDQKVFGTSSELKVHSIDLGEVHKMMEAAEEPENKTAIVENKTAAAETKTDAPEAPKKEEKPALSERMEKPKPEQKPAEAPAAAQKPAKTGEEDEQKKSVSFMAQVGTFFSSFFHSIGSLLGFSK